MASSGQSTATASQPSSDKQSTHNTQKLFAEVTEQGLVVGPNYAKWSSQAGRLIRSCIPIHYSDWRDVPQNFKDDLWNSLMEEFTFNIPSEVARIPLEKGFPPKWRVIKSRYRSIIKKCESLEEAIAHCPEGVDPNHWADFVKNNDDPEVKAKSTTNAENRKKRKDYNTLGRETYAQRIYTLNEKNPQKKHGRDDAWMDVHQLPDGTILECSREQYEAVKASIENDNANSNGTNTKHLLIQSDALTEVFGKDKGSRTRGFSSYISNKQVQRAALGKALLEQAEEKLHKCKAENSDTASRLDKLENLILNVLQNQANPNENSQPTVGLNGSPSAEVGTPSILLPSQSNPQSMMNQKSGQGSFRAAQTTPKVNLLTRDGAVVAKGFVETNATAGICHGKKVYHFERKIYVEEVLDGNAPIYDAPQYGNHILQDVTEGGYLIWPEGMLEYI